MSTLMLGESGKQHVKQRITKEKLWEHGNTGQFQIGERPNLGAWEHGATLDRGKDRTPL